MRSTLIFISSFIFISCNSIDPHSNPHRPTAKSALVSKAKRNVIEKLRHEKNLAPFGSGAQMQDEIKMLNLAFNYYGSVDEIKARDLLLAATNELLTAVNGDIELRPFLGDYPFGPKNVEIEIYLRNPDGSNPSSGNLSVITAINGILKYRIDDPKTNLFKATHQETYEQAMLEHSQALSLK